MKYDNIVKARFIERENRFVARVELCGIEVKVHVKNTGRCKELLIPSTTVYLEDFHGRMGKRKLLYSLIAVEKQLHEKTSSMPNLQEESAPGGETLLINMDSQAPNKVVEEALKDGSLKLPGMGRLTRVRPEQTFGRSRFDFYVESINQEDSKAINPNVPAGLKDHDSKELCAQKPKVVHFSKAAYVEVKGVTLEKEGFAKFPDAPTERGLRHIEELCLAKEAGFEAYIIFVIQMKKYTPSGQMMQRIPNSGRFLPELEKKVFRFLPLIVWLHRTA